MKNRKLQLGFVITICLLVCSCELLVVGAVTGTGTYLYRDGAIHGSFDYPLDKVWTACEKTMADLHANILKKSKAIATGDVSAMINYEKVEINIKYEGKNKTAFTIRKGLLGDETAAKFLYDKIRDNISKD